MCRTVKFLVFLTLVCCLPVSFRFWGCCAPASCCVAESKTLHTSLSLQTAPTLRGVSQHLTHAEFTYEPGEGMIVTYLSLSKDTGHASITFSQIQKEFFTKSINGHCQGLRGVHDLLTKLKPLFSYVKCNVNRVAAF